MLDLILRAEFRGDHMPGTAISLRTPDNQGAAQKAPDQILAITYPTADVQQALKAMATQTRHRPIVLLGDRGRGKSHIMAVMHHAAASPDVVESWIHGWGAEIGIDSLSTMTLAQGYFPISEPVHNHEYPLLWNLLFDRHPKGQYYRGQFELQGQPYPKRSLLEKMFADQPTCLILDEFQKWFDGLSNQPGDDGVKYRTWAENFIQNLSEIANDRPEILILAVSCLDNTTHAFQQVHRQGPLVIDFQTPSAKQDRQKLLLHRLFENRRNIPDSAIAALVAPYASERFRLLHSNKTDSEKEAVRQTVVNSWPFSPELLNLLEDHILLSAAAQETRDMIKILAQAFRTRGEQSPVLTAADFYVDGDHEQVQTLIDSISAPTHHDRLRQIAQRNLAAVAESGHPVPHGRELISAIWMRSLSPGKTSGGTPAQLHLDITRALPVDDNAFQAELALLIENSVNIHGDEVPEGPLSLHLDENPRSRVRANAKNPKLWQPSAAGASAQSNYHGMDIECLRKTLRHTLVPEMTQPPTRVIVLGPSWRTDPWPELDDLDHPAKWDRPVLLVLPESLGPAASSVGAVLGPWLVKHVPKRRNTVRFLLPASDAPGLFSDNELVYCARCTYLCSQAAWGSDPVYRNLHRDFDRQLRTALRPRYKRFAVLRTWNFQKPEDCTFEVDKLTEQGSDIPAAVERKLLTNHLDPVQFRAFVLKRATDSDFVGSLMDDLSDPPPPGTGDALPFLGETGTYELILKLVATGAIVLNVEGRWVGRRPEDATDEDAYRFVRATAFRSGNEQRKVQLGLPAAVGGAAINVPPPPAAAQPPVGTPATGTQAAPTGAATAPTPAPSGPSALEPPPGFPPAPPAALPTVRTSATPASGIHLSGCFEAWGVPPAQNLQVATVQFSDVTAQQLKQILQRFPSHLKATLEVTYQGGAEA